MVASNLDVAVVLFLVVVALSTIASLSMRIFVVLLELLQLDLLLGLLDLLQLRSRFLHVLKDRSSGLQLGLVQGIREFNREFDEQIAEFVGRLVEWKTHALASHQLIWLHRLALLALNSDSATVKMSHREVDSSQSFQKSDLFFHQKVCSLALESFIGSDLDDDHNVTWLNFWNAVSFSMDDELLSVGRALVHFDLDLLLFALDLFTLALLAPFRWIDHFSLTLAVVAGTSALRIHAWAHLPHGGLHSSALAAFA